MMIYWFSYFIKMMICQGGFLLVYQLLLRKNGRHQLNRYYLLATMVISMVIPVVQFQVYTLQPLPLSILEEEVVEPVELVLTKVTREPNASNHASSFDEYLRYGYLLYICSFIVLMLRFALNLKRIISQTKKLPNDRLKGIRLYETNDIAPFSFFDAVFIPRELKASKGYAQIVEHECAHARHGHSLDRLLADFIIAFLWFNPFIYWYRNALKSVHEFQADELVLKKYPDKIAYQEILYRQLFKPAYGLVNHFNTSLIKKRIVMMNYKRNTLNRFLSFLAVPITLLLSLAFSVKEVQEPVTEVFMEHIDIGPETDTSLTVTLPQGNDAPEILPIDKAKLKRMSSGFGMRKDPRTKDRRHHRGMDFSAPIGTDVYATADGVVIVAENRPAGYGTIVEISHGAEGKYTTRYAHLDKFLVENGQQVKKGDVIAHVGSSGWSKGPHLHYEVWLNGTPVNPEDYIQDHEF